MNSNVVCSLSYGYDNDGWIVTRAGTLDVTNLPAALASASCDANNRLTQWGSQTLSYDANGNLTGDGTKTYTWNTRNQLTVLNGSSTASFVYDAFGRRESKNINGGATHYLYDGLNIVQEHNSFVPTANFLTGANIDETFSRTASGSTQSYLTDNLGSTLALTSSTGAIQTSYAYDPYGNTTVTGTLSYNDLQYTGRENDGTGLYYYRARYYSPAYGRFISEDPIGFGGGINTYAYVSDNPINMADPLGLCPTCKAPPPFPPGENVDANIALAQNTHNFAQYLGPLNAQTIQLGFLANMEMPNQVWDYNSIYGKQYDAAGNFNFGAVSAAMGYGNYFAFNAGGMLKEVRLGAQGKLDPYGIPFLMYPYGNQALKQAMVQAGIDYYLCMYQ